MKPDAAYFREWRAKNPQYRKRQNELRNKRRAERGRENRQAEYAKRASRAMPPIPPLFVGHELFDTARFIVSQHMAQPPSGGLFMFRGEQVWQEAMGTALVAIIEGVDPDEAVRVCISRERTYYRYHAPIIIEVLT